MSLSENVIGASIWAHSHHSMSNGSIIQTHSHVSTDWSIKERGIYMRIDTFTCVEWLYHIDESMRSYDRGIYMGIDTSTRLYVKCLYHIHTFTCVEWLHHTDDSVGWLRLVGSLKWKVSFAEYSFFYRALLQKRPMILRSLTLSDDIWHKICHIDDSTIWHCIR